TSFMVSHDPTTVEDGGVEIDSNGNPIDNGFRVTGAGGNGNFYPRVAASDNEPNWLISSANNFTATIVQLVSSTADPNAPAVAGYVGAQFTNCGFSLVGSIAAPGAYVLNVFAHSTLTGTWNNVRVVPITVQAAVSNTKIWLDTPSPNQTTSQNLTIGGWAVDLGASTGTGVDAVHVYAYPTSGPAILVGVATYGTSRPDIA